MCWNYKEKQGNDSLKIQAELPLMKGKKMGSERHPEGFKWTDNIVFLELSGG